MIYESDAIIHRIVEHMKKAELKASEVNSRLRDLN